MGAETNGRHSTDDNFKSIFLNETLSISIRISLKFASKGRICNNSALVQAMSYRYRRTGNKPLSEPMMAYYMYTSLGLNELKASFLCTYVEHLFDQSKIATNLVVQT